MLAVAEEDPAFFAIYFLGLHLNPFNIRAFKSLPHNKQVMWVTANQCGKTVTISASHIWFNFYKKGFSGDPELIEQARYETLNLSPISRQATEAFRYIDEILHSKFSWEENGKRFINKCRIGWFFEGSNETMGRVDFANSSSCSCLSTSADQGAGLAGKQFAVISYDECVQSHHLEDELGARIFSRTAKYAGWVILISTPDDMGKSQQYWYHLYSSVLEAKAAGEKPEWFLVTGLYDENIFIPEEKRTEFKERLKKLSPAKYAQVVEGKFLAAADRMFPPEVVESLWNGKREPTEPKTIATDDGTAGRSYLLSIDWGVADGGDETVMLLADVTDLGNVEIVKAYAKQGGDPTELMAMATYLRMEYFDCPIVMDVTEMGGTIFKKMMSSFKPVSFGQGNKQDALFFLQLMLRENLRGVKKQLTNEKKSDTGKLKSYHLPKLERQLATYKLDDKKIKQDWVMALCMLVWYIEKYSKMSKIKVFNLNNFYKSSKQL